ncbi:MAG: AtpZ/AtpI family protein [Candidatus Taylorbacteria bacterium]|nr:AtpZ/AtpI family protein [Candidatus Taylorbacteria bacterium]
MEQNSGKEAWWQAAFEIFSQVSSWVVIPIIAALIVGRWLDGRFGTRPWIFLGLTAMAFLISIFGIVKTVRSYILKLEDNSSHLIGNPPMRREQNGKSNDSK